MDTTPDAPLKSGVCADFDKKSSIAILAIVVALITLPLVISRAFWIRDGRSQDDLVVFVLLPGVHLYLVLLCLLVLGRVKSRFVTLDYTWVRWDYSEAIGCVLLAIGLFMIAAAMSPLLYIFHLPHRDLVFVHNDSHAIAFAAARAVQGTLLAPILEEALWRGYVQGTLVKAFGAWPGIIGQASLFALLHFQPVLGCLQLLLMGLLFGIWRHRRNTMLPLILTHALNNALYAVAN